MRFYDFVVIGSGISGLYIADSLSSLGAKVAVLEKHGTIGSEASTRNGGYIHAGAYHSATIIDEIEAKQTALNCKAGADRIRARFPEACIEKDRNIHLLFRTEEQLAKASKRWKEFGINAEFIDRQKIYERYPHLESGYVIGAAAVADFPINTRLILMKLLADAKRNGVEVIQNARGIKSKDGMVSFQQGQEEHVITCKKVIFCTGAKTPLSTVEKLAEVNCFISIWKSHVLVAPEMQGIGFMFVDNGEVSVTPQNGYSVVCTRGDELRVTDISPDLDALTVEQNFRALCRAMPVMKEFRSTIRPHCCFKISISEKRDKDRNVSCGLVKLSDYEFFASPGKFTTAPILADLVVRQVARDNFINEVALRPGDNPL